MNNIIDNILTEWAYRVDDGMPNINNPLHIVKLRESMVNLKIPVNVIDTLIENLINEADEIPDRVKKKAKKMGLVWKRNGYGKEGEEGITHKVEDGKLVAVEDEEDSTDDKTTDSEEAGTAVQGAEVSTPFVKSKEKEAEAAAQEERQTKIKNIEPKGLRDILNKETAGYRNNAQYLNNEQTEVYDAFIDDIIALHTMEDGPEKQKLARIMVDKYGLERNSSGTKVYIKNISYEARKILGQNSKGVDSIRDTLENALGEPLPGEVKAADPKQIVTTTSKPDLGKESIVHAQDEPKVKTIFEDPIFEGIGEEFHQLHLTRDPNTGEILIPSNEHSLEYLKMSVSENKSLERTIEALEKDLEGQGVSPKIRKSLETHKKRMEDLTNGKAVDKQGNPIKVPSKEAKKYVEDSYAEMAEEVYRESPTLATGMMKNMAEMALYDSELAGGEEVYLPSHGSFPSGDKIKKEMGNSGVERVASVSVKWGSTGEFGSFGFPGECGQYQKWHPDPNYRNRNGSRPGDEGQDIGVNDELIDDDTQFDRVFEDSGLADCMKDRGQVKELIRGIKDYVGSEKRRIGYVQNAAQAKAQGKPTAKNQIKGIAGGIKKQNKELSKELAKHVDYDCMRKNLGKDNADLCMQGPMQLMNVLTFAGTLNTGNGLEGVEHNHQDIVNGKMESATEKGSPNPKLWKFLFRAFDDRGGGLLSSFNGNRINYDNEEEI
tara:strand:- start:447 stop:2594 length:2148 start_codon:yes stop_codon:yes gene_type:complete